MTNTVILTVLAILIRRGLKTSTMRGYLASMREDQITRGLTIKVFEKDQLSRAILSGKNNMEAFSPKERRGLRSPSTCSRNFCPFFFLFLLLSLFFMIFQIFNFHPQSCYLFLLLKPKLQDLGV